MITNLSIDCLVDRIQDARTREYMNEVLSCFYSGNYRSTVVMLYSVVICDLIYKLQQIKDLYQDQVSIDILTKIDQMQSDNPTNPQWENTLRDELLRNKRIITSVEAVHIDALQKERHLCAHPIIKDNAELHMPSKAAVYGHIVTALSDVLSKPALLDKMLLSTMLDDLDSKRAILHRSKNYLNYVRATYLDKIGSKEIEQKLIVGLWKFVFKLNDKKASDNRVSNLSLISELSRRNLAELENLVSMNSEKLSSQINVDDPTMLSMFVYYMNQFPSLYGKLTESFRITCNSQIDSNSLIQHVAFFRESNLNEFFDKILVEIAEDDDWKYMMAYFEKRFSEEDSLRIPINIFGHSDSFESASRNYHTFISSFLDKMTEKNLKELFYYIENNGQIKYSYKVQDYFQSLKRKALELNPDFDFSSFSFFNH